MKLGMCGFTIGAAAYMKQFPVVEVQQTFYDPPPPATLEAARILRATALLFPRVGNVRRFRALLASPFPSRE